MFETVTKVPTQNGAKAKVEGPTKKEFFQPSESRAIQLSMPKLPKPEILLKAIRDYDCRSLTNGQVDSLISVWPKESSIKELVAEKLGKNE
jgi:hypothetical protein